MVAITEQGFVYATVGTAKVTNMKMSKINVNGTDVIQPTYRKPWEPSTCHRYDMFRTTF